MPRLYALLTVPALLACADTPIGPVGGAVDDPAMLLTVAARSCVHFMKGTQTLPGAIDCEEGAHRLEVAFAGGVAAIQVAGIDIRSPKGTTGFRMEIEPAGPNAGQFGWLSWQKGSHDLNENVLPITVPQEVLEASMKKVLEARWNGNRTIDIPEKADRVLYYVEML